MPSLTLTAPAKINLFLSITGKNDNGYHALQSLIAFTKNFGDVITITPANEFSFSFDSTADHLPTDDNNLVICAANLLASTLGKDLNCAIHLSKHIPIGAGLGGGSSDAATTIKGLLKFWEVDNIDQKQLDNILLQLGADVPSCYHAQPCYFEGIGEIITPLDNFSSCSAVLVYPNQHCSTQDIFKNFNEEFSKPISLPANFTNRKDMIEFLHHQKNDLTFAAIKNIPEISDVLQAIEMQKNCFVSRMSGSGSACFGLFPTDEDARHAVKSITQKHPNWWIQQVSI